ncbi:MAG: HAD family hydrolase [Bacteroidota bacterium]
MIQVITIDFWNTLFDSSGGNERNALRQKAIMSEINNYNREISPELFEKALKASWEYFNKIWRQEMRTPSVQDSVAFFWKYLELPTDPQAINRIADYFANSVLIHPPKLIDGVADILPVLASRYKLGIISDTGFSPGIVLRKLLEQNNILHFFDSFSFSDETGYSKPHPESFRKVLAELGSNTSGALHIGDIEATDIVGAKQLGMYAIRFAGDSTGYFANESSNPTIADAIVYNWNEIPDTIENIC